MLQKNPYILQNKVRFVDTLSRITSFWDSAVSWGSESSHNVVQLKPDEDRYYLLTSYPTLMPPLEELSPESIRAFARNSNIDLESIDIYSRSDDNITSAHKNFKNIIQKWIENKDNSLTNL